MSRAAGSHVVSAN